MKQIVTSSSVDNQVQQFLSLHPRFSSRSGSKGACKFVSWELAKYLMRRGISASLYHLEGVVPNTYPQADKTWLDKSPKEWSHYVVKVNRIYYDLTHRQFDPEGPQPRVCDLSSLKEVWTTVEADSFLNGLAAEFCQSNI